MLCACHGEPAYWQKDARLKAGGYWECRVRRAEHNRTRTTDPERRARILTQRKSYWKRADGGYVRRRRQNLAVQRAEILEQLTQLDQEAKQLC